MQMTRRIVFVFLALVLALGGCQLDTGVKVIKMGHAQVVSHPVHQAMVFLGERLEEKAPLDGGGAADVFVRVFGFVGRESTGVGEPVDRAGGRGGGGAAGFAAGFFLAFFFCCSCCCCCCCIVCCCCCCRLPLLLLSPHGCRCRLLLLLFHGEGVPLSLLLLFWLPHWRRWPAAPAAAALLLLSPSPRRQGSCLCCCCCWW